MNDRQLAGERRPRSKARREMIEEARIRQGGALDPVAAPTPTEAHEAELVLFPRRAPQPPQTGAPVPPHRSPAPAAEAWEDTSILLAVPEQRTFLAKQPPAFWIVAALLMTAMFAVLFAVGIDMWRQAEISRAEERRLRQIAEEKAKYKLLHRDLIDAYAADRGLDPALVAAVVYNESRFDPMAVSRVGARGLMQIMKDTGGWIAEKLGEKSTYTQDSLFDPETNIRFGTWYLGFLSDMFDGDMIKMAAGYHAGQNQVLEWLANPAYSPDGEHLENIPFPDTEQYVSRVVNAYEIYTRHYYTPQESPAAQADS